MWYGIYKGIDNFNHFKDNDMLVSFRFDYFELAQSKTITDMMIIEFIIKNLNTKKIKFIQNMKPGVDNLYIGGLKNIKTLIEHFHFKLDQILNLKIIKRKKIFNQEYLVPIITEILHL